MGILQAQGKKYLHSEDETVVLLDRQPDAWTYLQIQSLFIREFERKQDLDI